MSRIVLLRHPRADAPPGLCYGRLEVGIGPDAPAEIAAALRETPPVTRVIASPARRCGALATALARRDGVPVLADPRLRELDFGRWEGRRWDAIDRAESDPWAEDPMERAPPGGERFRDLLARVAECLGAARAGDALVAHAGPIRAARMLLEDIGFAQAFAEPVPHAAPILLPLPREVPSWPIFP